MHSLSILKKFSLVVFLSRFDRDSWQGIGSAFINENFYEGDSLSKKNFECAPSNQGLRVLFLGGSSYIKGFYFLLLSSIFYRSSRKLEISVLGNVSFIATQLVKLFRKGQFFSDLWLPEEPRKVLHKKRSCCISSSKGASGKAFIRSRIL